jgi:L-fuculose-phosphate aldolase
MVYHHPRFDQHISINDDAKSGLISCAIELNKLGLNRGSSGNVSIRSEAGFLITPSGISPLDLKNDLIVEMDFEGNVISGDNPSSEWRFHRDILKIKQEVKAVIHTHSSFATAFSCLRKTLPPFHYMIAVAGGYDVKCAPYALFGSQELSDNVLESLKGRNACFLANHGMIALGSSLKKALDIAIEIESLSQQFLLLESIGDYALINDSEMSAVLEKFKNYGSWGK